MKNFLRILFVVSVLAFVLTGCGGLNKFYMDAGRNSIGPIAMGVPYTSTVKVFGYMKPGAPADAEVGGKKMFYLYVWIPAVAPEIGVRMFSPVGKLATPNAKEDIILPGWQEGASDAANYFDTWVSFEKAKDVAEPADIATKAAKSEWTLFGNSDDSSEMPKQPSGSYYNSLMRAQSSPSDPLKAIIKGLYRIGFTTYKVGEVKGSFYVEVGAPVKLPGVVIARTLDEVSKEVTKPAK